MLNLRKDKICKIRVKRKHIQNGFYDQPEGNEYYYGVIAQLVERVLSMHEALGSTPSNSIFFILSLFITGPLISIFFSVATLSKSIKTKKEKDSAISDSLPLTCLLEIIFLQITT